MAQAVPARLDAHFGASDAPVVHDAPALSPAATLGDIRITVHEDLPAIERDWRAFEAQADGTVLGGGARELVSLNKLQALKEERKKWPEND